MAETPSWSSRTGVPRDHRDDADCRCNLGFEKVEFPKPVFFGDTIRTEYKVREYDHAKKRVYADVTCTNQRGETVAVAVNVRAYIG